MARGVEEARNIPRNLRRHELLVNRELADSADWLILPIEASKEWSDQFGKDAERWRGLCNRLLDPNLSTETYSLERLAGELAALFDRD